MIILFVGDTNFVLRIYYFLVGKIDGTRNRLSRSNVSGNRREEQ
jgi:hypothetical protein